MAGKGSIYISNFAAAQDIHLLQSKVWINLGKGIKAILSVARSGLLHHSKEDVPYYLYLPAQDHEDYEIYKFFNQTYDFINQSRKHTNVLVHCMAGISRSVTIVIAYLLKKFKCSLGEVIRMLQRKRSKVKTD
jgi:protein-tyrosine phosphatase